MKRLAIILSLLFALLCSSRCFAYTYPIGIPAAWIEPDVAAPPRPAPWTSEVAGYYCVDYGSGTDSGRTYGTPAAPRKTIPSPIPAGSRVEVIGVYNPTTGTWFMTFAGDGGAWVAGTSGPAWVTGTDAENPAEFSGFLYIVGSYGCIEFINNSVNNETTNINSPTGGLGRKADHMLVRNSEFVGTGSASDGGGVSINGNTDELGASTHVVFYNNEVHGFGISEPDGSDPDFIAVYVSSYSNYIWILDNELHDMSGSAVQMGGNTTDTPYITHVYAGRNHCYNLWGTGMSAKTSRYIVYSQNHIHDVKDNAEVSRSKGMAGQYAATDQWMIFNTIHDCAYGILRVSGNAGVEESLYIIGNLIYDCYPLGRDYEPPTSAPFGAEAAISIWGADHCWIVNNTIYDTPNGVHMPLQVQEIIIENNIISTLSEATGSHVYGENTGALKDITVDKNLIYEPVNDIVFKFPGESAMDVAALNASAYGGGNIEGDPLFTNAAGDIFALTASSPAVGEGSATLIESLEATYLATFGESISFDRAGTARPQGGTWDIGAYEYAGTMNATTLNITNLTVGP